MVAFKHIRGAVHARVWLVKVHIILLFTLLIVSCNQTPTSPLVVEVPSTGPSPLSSPSPPTSSSPGVSPSSTPTVAATTAACQVNATDGLNLRNGPGTQFELITLFPHLTSLTVLERNSDGTWLRVSTASGSETGWVKEEFVTCSNATNTPAAQPSGPVIVGTAPSLNTESPLKRNDVPPEGIEPLLAVGGMGNPDPCQQPLDLELEGPRIVLRTKVELLQWNLVCFFNFTPNQDIQVEILDPLGGKQQDIVSADETGRSNWGFFGNLSNPLGLYTVTAIQGTKRAEAQFQRQPTTQPRYSGIEPGEGSPGTIFTMSLVGYTPGQSFSPYLYKAIPESACSVTTLKYCWKYITSLPTIQVNEQGEAVYSIPTQSDDPEGIYYFFSGSSQSPQVSGFFCVITNLDLVENCNPRLIDE